MLYGVGVQVPPGAPKKVNFIVDTHKYICYINSIIRNLKCQELDYNMVGAHRKIGVRLDVTFFIKLF